MSEDYEEDAFEDEDEEEEDYGDDEFEETGRLVGTVSTSSYKRYKPWQEKALRLLDHSKDTFDYDIVVPKDQKLLFDLQDVVRDETKAPKWTTLNRMKQMILQFKKGRKTRGVKTNSKRKRNVWESAIAGDTKAVQMHVVLHGMDVRDHYDKDGGSTLLHYASWYAHVDLTKWLISHVRQTYGPDALENYVNITDTVCHKSTPLIEVARNNIGYLDSRLEVLRILLEAGARISDQDSSGDTCLHWAIRRLNLPFVRYIMRNSTGMERAKATRAKNFSNQTPEELALHLLSGGGGELNLRHKSVVLDKVLHELSYTS